MKNESPPSQPRQFQIRIGCLDSRWDWLEGLTVSHVEPCETIIRGRVADDTALHGVLERIRDLDLPWISFSHVGPVDPGKENRDG